MLCSPRTRSATSPRSLSLMTNDSESPRRDRSAGTASASLLTADIKPPVVGALPDA
jgi:hypothetical protein